MANSKPLQPGALFGQSFPFLIKHLPKPDILTCRLVNKDWCHGIDNFLSNNFCHQPSLKESEKTTISIPYVTFNDPLLPLHTIFENLNYSEDIYLHYTNILDSEKREDMIAEGPTRTRSPFIGQALCLFESAQCFPNSSNTELLKLYGHHVKTLSIDLGIQTIFQNSQHPNKNYFTVPGAMNRILELLCLVPNLRKLGIKGRASGYQTMEEYKRTNKHLQMIIKSSKYKETKGLLSNLETLNMSLYGEYTLFFSQVLFDLLGNSNLQSLKLRNLLEIPQTFNGANITDLNLVVFSDKDLSDLLNLKFPLRHLYLEYDSCSEVDSNILFEVIRHFQGTLVSLTFKYSCNIAWRRNLFQKAKDNVLLEKAQRWKGFMDPEVLKGISHLKRVSLEGMVLPSYNFLKGISNTLEYLHIGQDDFDFQAIRTKEVCGEECPPESLDLLKVFAKLYFTREISMYQSNIWNTMRKLKGLSVSCYKMGIYRNYKRNFYDYFYRHEE